MNKEIKRILDYLINEKSYLHYGIRREKFIELEGKEVKTLLNYITNLQQENETLKAKLNIGKTCGFCPYYKYKHRIDKAIKLINKRKDEQDNGIGWVEMRTKEYFEECDEVLNILKGSDKE